MTNTIVTAFITNVNQNRSIEDYIEYGKYMLATDINQVIFIEREIFKTYFNYSSDILQFCYEGKEYEYIEVGNKSFVFFERSDIYLYNYNVNQFEVNTHNPMKDTLDYMFIQCHKTEWVKIATELKKDMDGFIWVDFGIYYIINNEEQFNTAIEKIKTKEINNKIRIGSFIDICVPDTTHIYKTILWYFAGGVFGGTKDSICEFANRMKKKCLQIISEQETLMWEINAWYMIFMECPELFDPYVCRHDLSILSEF